MSFWPKVKISEPRGICTCPTPPSLIVEHGTSLSRTLTRRRLTSRRTISLASGESPSGPSRVPCMVRCSPILPRCSASHTRRRVRMANHADLRNTQSSNRHCRRHHVSPCLAWRIQALTDARTWPRSISLATCSAFGRPRWRFKARGQSRWCEEKCRKPRKLMPMLTGRNRLLFSCSRTRKCSGSSTSDERQGYTESRRSRSGWHRQAPTETDLR